MPKWISSPTTKVGDPNVPRIDEQRILHDLRRGQRKYPIGIHRLAAAARALGICVVAPTD